MKKYLLPVLATAGLALGASGCDPVSLEARCSNFIDGVCSQEQLVKRLQGQSAQAGEVAVRVYLVPRSKVNAKDPNIYDREQTLFSLDNQTVVIPKPEDGYFEKDMFVRRTKNCKGIEKELEEFEVCEDAVMVRHYSTGEKGKISISSVTPKMQEVVIDKDSGVPVTQRPKQDFDGLWIPRDAFDVRLISRTGEVVGDNLLAEQDLLVTPDGSIVLKTQKLGPEGKYQVRVRTKFRKEIKPVQYLEDATTMAQLNLVVMQGMSFGSMQHIYTGPDPAINGEGDLVSLFLTNYHVFSDTLDLGKIKTVGRNGKTRMAFASVSAMPLIKLDDAEERPWLKAEVFRNVYDHGLDMVVVNSENPVKGMPKIEWAKQRPKVGDQVTVVGHPMGLQDTIVNPRAIVGKVNHDAGRDFKDAILIYGDVIGGNSGGGLYNAKGEFIGMPSATYVTLLSTSLEEARELPIEGFDLKDFEGKDVKTIASELFDKFKESSEVQLAIQEANQEMARTLADQVAEEYELEMKGEGTGRVMMVRTPLNLARDGQLIQDELHTRGIDVGQPFKKPWEE